MVSNVSGGNLDFTEYGKNNFAWFIRKNFSIRRAGDWEQNFFEVLSKYRESCRRLVGNMEVAAPVECN